jgi:hypothetical protein
VSVWYSPRFVQKWIQLNSVLTVDGLTLSWILIRTYSVTGHNMSSKLPSILSATEEDIQLLLAAQCHVGTKNCDKKMEPYVWKRRVDGEHAVTNLTF